MALVIALETEVSAGQDDSDAATPPGRCPAPPTSAAGNDAAPHSLSTRTVAAGQALPSSPTPPVPG